MLPFKRDLEVLVVGAGPVGLAAGLALAQRDVRVQVIDEQPRTAARSYALALHPRSLEVLSELGLAEELIALGHKVEAVAFYEGSRRRTEVRLCDRGAVPLRPRGPPASARGAPGAAPGAARRGGAMESPPGVARAERVCPRHPRAPRLGVRRLQRRAHRVGRGEGVHGAGPVRRGGRWPSLGGAAQARDPLRGRRPVPALRGLRIHRRRTAARRGAGRARRPQGERALAAGPGRLPLRLRGGWAGRRLGGAPEEPAGGGAGRELLRLLETRAPRAAPAKSGALVRGAGAGGRLVARRSLRAPCRRAFRAEQRLARRRLGPSGAARGLLEHGA